ncbi:MAG: GNAT family N-acetyltransferase [Erysipelotrichaceae bacterium]|nr:GNAT family N-acetyltransferase [Erysipelotrichaceae bacterium]
MKNHELSEFITIRKVDKDTVLAEKLLDFVKHFSWLEVNEHTIHQIRNWEFEDWETPFVALHDGNIVGMCTIMKTDYYPLSVIYPWISTIFVSEEYRGHRISGMLIDYANGYVKEIGFAKTYIPTSYVGLYEKYGYHYLKDIVNYGNDIDRLYVKDC